MHLRRTIVYLSVLSLIASCGGSDSTSSVSADKLLAPLRNTFVTSTSDVNISDYLSKDISSSLSIAGIWEPVDIPDSSTIPFWNIAKLGIDQREGIILSGWAYTGFDNTATDVTQVNAAILDQQIDGTLKLATSQYVPSAATNGVGSILVADFNEDGKDDAFLSTHNESPFIAKPSIAYLSKPDGTFSKVTLTDKVMNHHSSLAYINGKPSVLATSFVEPNTPFEQQNRNPIYTYNGKGGFDVYNGAGYISAMSVTAADYVGNGKTQIIYGDVNVGPDFPFSPANIMQQFAFQYVDGKLATPKVSLPAPYFNKPQFSHLVSDFEPSKTHNSRLWTDDVNNDGKPDVVVGAEVWSASKGLQKSALQMLVNKGNLQFEDQTDALNPDYNQDAFYDYSLRMADIDQSGIKTYLASQNTFSELINGTWIPQKSRHGNYILVNDGSGRFHVAMHAEFEKMGDTVNQYLAGQLIGGSYYVNPNGDTPRFIAYQTPSGLINFLAVVAISEKVNEKWVKKFALVNVPLQIELTKQYKQNLTVTNRNGSHQIRTFAGNDTIYSGNNGGEASVDGGLGFNTVVYSGKRANYTVTKTSSGYVVKDDVASDGTDRLKNIQTLKFADSTVNLAVSDKAKSISPADLKTITELYVAFFNRVPDADGLSYWVDQLKAGQTIDHIAQNFYNAAVQYSSLTGYTSTMSNADFVKVIYKNVLGRSGATAPPEEDVQFWAGELVSGRATKGTLIRTVLASAHSFTGDAKWGWVAQLLDNKYAVASYFAVQQGLGYNTPEDSITRTMAIAAAVTPTSTSEAMKLIGIQSLSQ